jgi:hypothetical protein
MRRERVLWLIGLGLGCLLLGLPACGMRQHTPGQAPTAPAQQPGAGSAAPSNGTSAQRNLLRLTIPALSGLTAGSEFDVTMGATTVEPLFQASARLLFDPAQLEPLRATPGQFGPGRVALARTDAALQVDGAGCVPFAFTSLPGSGGLPPAAHELLRVRFRVRQAIKGNAGLHLLSDPAYLQLRAVDGRRLSFDLSEEVAAR